MFVFTCRSCKNKFESGFYCYNTKCPNCDVIGFHNFKEETGEIKSCMHMENGLVSGHCSRCKNGSNYEIPNGRIFDAIEDSFRSSAIKSFHRGEFRW